MKKTTALDPHVQKEIRLIENYSGIGEENILNGPIVPQWLPVAFKRLKATRIVRSRIKNNASARPRMSYQDMVSMLVLTEIISAYRPKNGKVFWNGPLYQMRPVDLARRLGCSRGDISRALKFLESANLITRVRMSNMNEDGEYAGSGTYPIPNTERIVGLLRQAEMDATSCSSKIESALSNKPEDRTTSHEAALNKKSVDGEQQLSLKAPNRKRKRSEDEADSAFDADAQGASRGLAEHAEEEDESSLTRAPEAQAAKERFKNGQSVQHSEPPTKQQSPSSKTTAKKSPPDKAQIFGRLWKEAIQRMGMARSCRPTQKELTLIGNYFSDEPQIDPYWLIHIAILAWNNAAKAIDLPDKKKRRFYWCLQSETISDFIHGLSGLQAELHKHGEDLNQPYPILRWCFTPSELVVFGMKESKVFQLEAQLDEPEQKSVWESHDPDFACRFYEQRERPLPPEFTQTAHADDDEPIR